MTEAEWLEGTDPKPMLEFLSGKASERKLRLFICSFLRQLFPPSDPRTTVIAVGEKYADGTAGNEELQAARTLARSREPYHALCLVIKDSLSCMAYPSLDFLAIM